MTPRKRVVLDGRVYIEFKHRVFEDNRDVLCLQLLGVIREKGDVVELWAADEALGNETMQLMLGEAERMQRVRDDHCFQVILESVPPFVFKWKNTLTLAGACVTQKPDLRKPLCFRFQLYLLAQVSATFFADSSPSTLARSLSRILAEI